MRALPSFHNLGRNRRRATVGTALVLAGLLCNSAAQAADGRLALSAIDKETNRPIAVRMHLKSATGRPRLVRKAIAWDDHFIIPGEMTLDLPVGSYTFEVERGPEYAVTTGHFTINNNADDAKTIEMERKVDMAANGWWSGDLDVRRPPAHIKDLIGAEDLHVVPLQTWWNGHSEWSGKSPPEEVLVRFDENRFAQLMAGQQTWPGGSLLYLNLASPVKLIGAEAEYPPIGQAIEAAREQPGAWIDLTRPFWWDLPTLVALGQVDSIQVAHAQIGRNKIVNTEAGGKPRDLKRWASASGNAQWSQEIYFKLLECGLKIPPSAGSGSGVFPNPMGYNRMYVHVEGDFTYERWWENFRAGRVTITNGPLLQPSVRGEPPGAVFHGEKGQPLEFEIGLTLSLREPLTYLEIIKNGRVEHEVRFDQFIEQKGGRLPKVRFDESGWFLVRVVTDQAKTYRFAMTAPYFVEIGYQPRVSKKAAQFFLDWVVERAKQIQIDDPQKREEAIGYHRRARDFWQDLVNKANVE